MATVNDFIIDMELSAKRILRDANRKQKDAARREEYEASKSLKNESKGLKKSSSAVLIPSVTERLDKKVGMLGTTGSASQTMSKTRVLQYSIPRMVVTMGTSKLDEEYRPDVTKSLGISPRQLSPIQKRRTGNDLRKSQATKSKVYAKLDSSPFLSQSVPSISALLEKKKVTEAEVGNVDLEAPTKQTDWALKIHASSVFAGKTKSKKTFGHTMPTDSQGPIDWSSEGLRAKYRGEQQREEAWQAWQDAASFTVDAVEQEGLILPVTKMERHPMYVLYYERLEYENAMSRYRTKNRLRMKRFVMDVQEVWLTNLKHLQEHQPMDNFFETPPGARPSTDGGHSSRPRQSAGGCVVPIAVGSAIPALREEGWSEGVLQEHYGAEGSGLNRRRDVDAIMNMHSQIQSVSLERAMESTYVTGDVAAFPEPTPELDWVPAVPPCLDIAPPVPFGLESLVSGFVTKTVSGRPVVLFIDRLLPPKPVLDIDLDGEDADKDAGDTASVATTGSDAKQSKSGGKSKKKKGKSKKKGKYVSGSRPVLPDEPTGASVWRITALRMEDGRVRHRYASESFIDAFISNAMADSGFLSHVTNTSRGEKDIVLFNDTHDLKWGRSEVACDLTIRVVCPDSVSVDGSFEELRDSGRVVITANLAAEYEHFPPLILILSAVEFLSCLHIPVERDGGALSPLVEKNPIFSCPPNQPWWTRVTLDGGESVVDEPQIERFLSLLMIPTGEFNEEGDAIPGSLQLRDEDASPSGAVGGSTNVRSLYLPTCRAISFAHYLTRLVTVNFQELAVSASFTKKATSSSVSLEFIPWNEVLVVASGGGDMRCLVRRPRFQASLSEGKSGDIEPADGIMYTGGLYENDAAPNQPYASFEDIADDVTPLSMRVSGGFSRMDQIPGSIVCGVTRGPWFTYPLHPERTKVSANMFRDKHLSSTDSVLVNVTQALDTAVLAPIQLSWETHSEIPVRAPIETVSGAYVSMRMAPPKRLLSEPLLSPLEDRNNPLVMAFNSIAEEGTDFVMPTGLKPPRGMFRRFPDVDDHGFRRKKTQYLLGVDPDLPTIVFGVTKLGALPNSTGVHTRNVWHAAVAVTDHINR